MKVWIANREVKRTQSVYSTIEKKFLIRAISELQDDYITASDLCPFLSTHTRFSKYCFKCITVVHPDCQVKCSRR